MPLYVADYLSATAHLNAAESGAYLHLLMHYWQKGALPQEDRFLARIARMTDRQWAAAKPVLLTFFGDNWVQSRLESERAKALSKAEARAESGSRGGLAKSLNNKKQPVAKASDSPDVSHKQKGDEALPFSQGLDTTSVVSVKAPKGASPLEVLKTALPEKLAKAVVDHRARLRKPLTPFAAELLAKTLLEMPDPDAAARLMIERGWMSVKAEWVANATQPRAPPAAAKPSRLQSLINATMEPDDEQPDHAALDQPPA